MKYLLITKTLLFSGMLFLCGVDFVFAQNTEQEAIIAFDTQIQVQTDGSILVIETIQYTTGNQEKHGIYRDIRTESSQGKEMKIEDIEVLDAQGSSYPFEEIAQSDNLRLKIGDPNKTFSGIRTYVIQYRATHAVGYFEQFDEVYWNTTGNNWPFPILSATARVALPNGATAKQVSCYEGPSGSQEFCEKEVSWFAAKRILNPGEGMTVAVEFTKGIVTEKFSLQERLAQFLKVARLLLVTGLVIWVGGGAYRHWYRYGRDPKERDVVVPEYDVPDNLTPLEVSGILSEAQIDHKAYIAEILSLATRGYIRIHQDQEKYVFGLITTNDYELERLSKNDKLKSFDGLFLEKIFKGETRVRLSSLKNSFYKEIPAISTIVTQSLKTEGYYVRVGIFKKEDIWGYTPFTLAILLMVVGGVIFRDVVLGLGSLLACLIYLGFMLFSPQKTEKGMRTKEQLKGLKLYIEKAEKARIEFHDAPEKTPELFSGLLPYAMVLGTVAIWLKEFEDLHYANPDWYVATGANGSMMNGNFFQDFESFSQAMTASTAAPGSSGSGSSGGGGGGGGGGSW